MTINGTNVGGATEGDEAVDNHASGKRVLVVWPEYVRDLAFVLGVFDGGRHCAICRDDVRENGGVTIVLMEDGLLKPPGMHFHHRCAGLLAGAIEGNYAELEANARLQINQAEACFGLGHA